MPVVLPFLIIACDKEVGSVRAPASSPPKLEANLQSVQTVLVNARCVSCHAEPTAKNRQVVLTDIQQVIEKPHAPGRGAHPRYLIKPGCPKQSFFLSIIKSGSMPPRPDERVSAEDIKTLEAFIVSLNPKAGKMCDDEPPDLEEVR